jgi:hypothetical protein
LDRGKQSMQSSTQLKLAVLPQPDYMTCGPTCLHAVYGYYGDEIALDDVIAEIEPLPGGGTLAVSLACHALKRGYAARIYTYNLQVFDPTWFSGEISIADRLLKQSRVKPGQKLAVATRAYLNFLELGGNLRFEELTRALIRRTLYRKTPILTGLSATYLYGCAREFNNQYDDTRGVPMGHFVVVSGYDRKHRQVMVADPLQDNPLHGNQYYSVDVDRLVGAILLGILTYDANLLVISPRDAR